MKHLKAFGLIVAVILFLLCLVGFELHTLGKLGRTEPDNPILQQAVVQSSIFALLKVFVLLYIIYVSILYCIEIYKKVQEHENTQARVERILNKLTKLAEQDNIKATESMDFPLKQEYEKVNEVEFKELVKPLIENYEDFREYKVAIRDYYSRVGMSHLTIAQELSNKVVFPIEDIDALNEVCNILSLKFKDVNIDVIQNVLISYCTAKLRDIVSKQGTEEA